MKFRKLILSRKVIIYKTTPACTSPRTDVVETAKPTNKSSFTYRANVCATPTTIRGRSRSFTSTTSSSLPQNFYFISESTEINYNVSEISTTRQSTHATNHSSPVLVISRSWLATTRAFPSIWSHVPNLAYRHPGGEIDPQIALPACCRAEDASRYTRERWESHCCKCSHRYIYLMIACPHKQYMLYRLSLEPPHNVLYSNLPLNDPRVLCAS